MAALLRCLIMLSEKAASLARIIRSEEALFSLLVEEKTGEQKNKRFVRDFKTLADVLIQEMIRHDIAMKFPSLGDFVFGEESNEFTNTLGESIKVAIQPNQEDTRSLLTKVLDGNSCAASLLAAAVHREVVMETEAGLDGINAEVDVECLGIWIDPIDGTAQYIKGASEEPAKAGIHQEGLECAIILIGAFNRISGEPVMGVVNQPFHQLDPENCWEGRRIWGIDAGGGVRANSLSSGSGSPLGRDALSVIISMSEDGVISASMQKLTGGNVHRASGAGYKILCAIDRLVDAYVLSKGSTFKWDTCAPHAVLRSAGGGIVDLRMGLALYRAWVAGRASSDPAGLDLSPAELRYERPDGEGAVAEAGQKWANTGGIVAYRSKDVALRVLEALAGSPDL